MNQLIDPALARNMADSSDVAAQQRKLDAMRREMNGGGPKDKQEKLREACEGFEAVFIQKMWEQMRATVPQESPLHSKDEKMWQGMYDQELSKKMAGAGGIGLADMMMTQLGKNLEEAGQKAVNTSLSRREAMPIAPAPLLLDAAPVPGTKKPAAAATGDIYSGAADTVAEGGVDEGDVESVVHAPVAPPSEFDTLVNGLQVEMQQPVVTVTRITTNSNSISTFNSLKGVRSGRGQANPRVVRHTAPQNVPQSMTPQAASGTMSQAASVTSSQMAPGTSPLNSPLATPRVASGRAAQASMQPQTVSGAQPQPLLPEDAMGVMMQDAMGVMMQDAMGVVKEDAMGVVKEDAMGVTPTNAMGVTGAQSVSGAMPRMSASEAMLRGSSVGSPTTLSSPVAARPATEPGPAMSPTAVSQARTTGLASVPRYRR